MQTVLKRRKKSGYGYIPDIADIRDFSYTPEKSVIAALPPKVDLTPPFQVYDQGRIGSCTANALAAAIQFERIHDKQSPEFIPSRLFIYYNERKIEGHVNYDSGAMIRDGIKVLHKLGVCPEKEWPYGDTPADPRTEEFPPGNQQVKNRQINVTRMLKTTKSPNIVGWLKILITLKLASL